MEITATKGVCLVEYGGHYEVLRSLGELFLDLKMKVTVLTNPWGISFLQRWAEAQRITLHDYQKLSAGSDLLMNSDLYIYTSPFPYEKVNHVVVDPGKAFLLIHNVNYWLSPFNNIRCLRNFSLLDGLRFLKYWPLGMRRKNENFLKQFRGLLAPNHYSYDLYKEKFSGFLDFSYARPHVTVSNESLNVVSPGTANRDRDLIPVIRELSRVAIDKKTSITYTLLGINRTISERTINKWSHHYFQVVTYDQKIPITEYDKVLNKASFAIIPLREYKSYKGIAERRGYTNLSGSIHDVIRSGIPALIPHYYPFHPLLRDLFIVYRDPHEAGKIIDQWVHNHEYMKIKKKAENIISKYFEHLLEEQEREISRLINKEDA